MCVTFRLQGDPEQTILTNYDPANPTQFNEISATDTEIYIWGQKYAKFTHVIIRHMCRDWTTLFAERFITEKQMYGNYIINGDEKIKGTFTFDHSSVHTSDIFAESRVNNTQFLTGAIRRIEMYYTRRKEKKLPYPLKQLIIQNQMVVATKTHISRRLIRNIRPLKKKKKIYSSL